MLLITPSVLILSYIYIYTHTYTIWEHSTVVFPLFTHLLHSSCPTSPHETFSLILFLFWFSLQLPCSFTPSFIFPHYKKSLLQADSRTVSLTTVLQKEPNYPKNHPNKIETQKSCTFQLLLATWSPFCLKHHPLFPPPHKYLYHAGEGISRVPSHKPHHKIRKGM